MRKPSEPCKKFYFDSIANTNEVDRQYKIETFNENLPKLINNNFLELEFIMAEEDLEMLDVLFLPDRISSKNLKKTFFLQRVPIKSEESVFTPPKTYPYKTMKSVSIVLSCEPNLTLQSAPVSGFNIQTKEFLRDNFYFNHTHRILILNGLMTVKLSRTESKIISLLAKNMGRTVTREELLARVWSKNDHFTSRTLDTYISKLRKLLVNAENVNIETERSTGFKLVVENI